MSAPAWTPDTQRHDAASAANPQLALMWPLLGRRIAFHRRLVDLTGSVKAAVLLSQAIYWTRHGRDITRTDGWFHKSTAQWELETGLTVREQVGARDILCKLGLINTRRRGMPAVLYFQLEMQRLGTLLAERVNNPVLGAGQAHVTVVLELLGPPLAYHRSLAAIAGGVHAGLLLSRALYLTRYASRALAGGWIYASPALWTVEIGLGRWEQAAARRQLVRCGVWDEHLEGTPPRLCARVCRSALLALLTQHTTGEKLREQRASAADWQACGYPVSKTVVFPPSRRREYHHPDSTKPATQFQQNQPHSFNNTCQLNVHRSTRCLVQTPLQPPLRKKNNCTDAANATGGGNLIMPQQLLPAEREAALTLVSRCPQQAQALLDELTARLHKNAIHTSPIGYLRGLVQRAMAGAFVPELAAGIAAARQRQAEGATAREQREADLRRIAAEQATPEFQAQAAARRAQVRQMLDAMRARHQPRKAS